MKKTFEFRALIEDSGLVISSCKDVLGLEASSLEEAFCALLVNPQESSNGYGFNFKKQDFSERLCSDGQIEIIVNFEMDIYDAERAINEAKELKRENWNDQTIDNIDEAIFEILVASNKKPSFDSCGFKFSYLLSKKKDPPHCFDGNHGFKARRRALESMSINFRSFFQPFAFFMGS